MVTNAKRTAWVLAVLLTSCACLLATTEAATRPSGGGTLEDLGDTLIDDAQLQRLIDSANKAKASGEDAARGQPRLLPDVDELRRMLDPNQHAAPAGEDIAQPGESPLVRISSKMAQAGDLIAAQNTTGQTREVQQEIVSELDKLIDKLNKQCQACSGGQCNKPGEQQTQSSTPKPAGSKPSSSGGTQSGPQQSKVSSGGGGESQPGEVADRDVVKQLWGQLPERLRQQLMQSTADEFLPKYRAELELYFRRLAEEQSTGDSTR